MIVSRVNMVARARLVTSRVIPMRSSVVISAVDDRDCLSLALARHIVDKTVLARDPA
jgi:hypothetical protein